MTQKTTVTVAEGTRAAVDIKTTEVEPKGQEQWCDCTPHLYKDIHAFYCSYVTGVIEDLYFSNPNCPICATTTECDGDVFRCDECRLVWSLRGTDGEPYDA